MHDDYFFIREIGKPDFPGSARQGQPEFRRLGAGG
jgi:hypothetical protein